MNKYKGLISKSRTYDFAAIVAVLGMVEQNLPLVREQLGNWYGWILMAISGAIIYYRKTTTGPVGVKS